MQSNCIRHTKACKRWFVWFVKLLKSSCIVTQKCENNDFITFWKGCEIFWKIAKNIWPTSCLVVEEWKQNPAIIKQIINWLLKWQFWSKIGFSYFKHNKCWLTFYFWSGSCFADLGSFGRLFSDMISKKISTVRWKLKQKLNKEWEKADWRARILRSVKFKPRLIPGDRESCRSQLWIPLTKLVKRNQPRFQSLRGGRTSSFYKRKDAAATLLCLSLYIWLCLCVSGCVCVSEWVCVWERES